MDVSTVPTRQLVQCVRRLSAEYLVAKINKPYISDEIWLDALVPLLQELYARGLGLKAICA